MKIDNGYFYNIEPLVDIEHFVELFLVTLAKNDSLQPLLTDTRKKRIAIIPQNYKEKIESIMYSKLAINFLRLIDSYQYYEKQSSWESKFAENLKEYLKNNNKVAKYNFNKDYIEISYSIEEIDKILKKYDKETQEIMEDLVFEVVFNCEYDRHSKLVYKEAKRSITRDYIATSPTTYTNVWTKTSSKEDKTVKITVNPEYTKK